MINNRSLNKVLYNNAKLADTVKPSKMSKAFVTMFTILSPIAKIVYIMAIIFCFITILLIPVVGGIIAYMMKNLHNKLPALVESQVTPQLNHFLLPPISKS